MLISFFLGWLGMAANGHDACFSISGNEQDFDRKVDNNWFSLLTFLMDGEHLDYFIAVLRDRRFLFILAFN
jgi:hypothetical protein